MTTLLNLSSERVAAVVRSVSPLVVLLKGGSYAWIQSGIGHILHPAQGTWTPLVDAEGIGGHVLNAGQVDALAAAYGRPVAS